MDSDWSQPGKPHVDFRRKCRNVMGNCKLDAPQALHQAPESASDHSMVHLKQPSESDHQRSSPSHVRSADQNRVAFQANASMPVSPHTALVKSPCFGKRQKPKDHKVVNIPKTVNPLIAADGRLLFTPAVIDYNHCMARTWNNGLGAQCGVKVTDKDPQDSSSELCIIHRKQTKMCCGLIYGRVDAPVPACKLREFQNAQRRKERDAVRNLAIIQVDSAEDEMPLVDSWVLKDGTPVCAPVVEWQFSNISNRQFSKICGGYTHTRY